MNQHDLLLRLYHDQRMQTLRLPILQRSCRDEDDRRNAFLEPSNKIVKRGAGHFGVAPGDMLSEEQDIQYWRAYLLSFQQATEFFLPQGDALKRQYHPHDSRDTGVAALRVRLGQIWNL